MTFDALLTQLRKNAAEIDKIANKLGVDLQEVMHPEIIKLNNCLDTYSAFKVLVATVVNDAQGKLDLNKGIAITSNFDKNWDAFAKEFNEIFNGLDKKDQANILETFAKEQFGINVFNAGSVLKNETPNILSGIAGFKAGVNSFKGSYRNPIEAANKIRNGVNAIVHSTEAIARSANKIVGTLKQFKNPEAKGSVILDKLSNLSAYKPVSFALDAVNKAAGAVNIAGNLGSGLGNASNAIDALKKGDLKGAAASVKSASDNVKNIKAEIQAMRGNGDTPTGSGLSEGTGSGSKGDNPYSANESEEVDNQENSNRDKDKEEKDSNSGSSDSYVCSKAKIKCTNGDKISTLTVFPTRTIWLTGEPQANISDHIPMQNIAPFGRCHTTAYPPTAAATAAAHGKLTPMPCVPNTPFPWMGGKNDVLLQNQPALLKSSKCKCIYGGTITITFDGQGAGNTSGIPYNPKEDFSISTAVEGGPTNKKIIQNGQEGMIIKASNSSISNKSVNKKKIISERTASLVLPGFEKLSEGNKKGILRAANALPDSINIADKLKLADHTRDIARELQMKIDAPMSIDEADKQSANPNYADGNDYSINCATVAATYALRLRGLNLTAKAKNNDNKLNVWLSEGNSFKVWRNVDGTEAKPSTYVDWMKTHTLNKKPITEMTPGLYKRFIEDNTKEEGVYIITVGWKEGGGHATIIQRWRDEKGELQLSYIEPQVYSEKAGVKQSIDSLVRNMDKNPHPSRGIMRVDNKMFDTKYVSLFEKPNGNTENNKMPSQKLN